MSQPKGFEVKGKENHVCKLKKVIYGLKQGGREWNNKLDTTLKGLSLNQLNADQCISYDIKNKKILIIAVFVDDLTVFTMTKSFGNLHKSIVFQNLR